jgi:hypothetical protein
MTQILLDLLLHLNHEDLLDQLHLLVLVHQLHQLVLSVHLKDQLDL